MKAKSVQIFMITEKEGYPYVCLSVILIDSGFKVGENYYPQVFLEKCKYIVKEK